MAALAIAGEGNWLVVVSVIAIRVLLAILLAVASWLSAKPCLRLIKIVCVAKMKVETLAATLAVGTTNQPLAAVAASTTVHRG